MQKNYRKYGKAPYRIVVVHGGPGGAGEVAPIAKELSQYGGSIEPFQTEKSVEGQVEELFQTIQKESEQPVTLIGFSWGAWLSLLVAATYPSVVKKLILIGCPPLVQKDAADIMQRRLSRLSKKEQKLLLESWDKAKEKAPSKEDLNAFITLFIKADGYSVEQPDELPYYNSEIFNTVWPQAEEMRQKGVCADTLEKIECPVVCIHGEVDPHPFESIQSSFSKHKVEVLKKCGHRPWLERQAKEIFYVTLQKEI